MLAADTRDSPRVLFTVRSQKVGRMALSVELEDIVKIIRSGRHFARSVMSAITNKGSLRWMVNKVSLKIAFQLPD